MTETTPPSSALENPLWQFSVDFYQQPQVEQFLLECQDSKGADVCLLLWASYVSAAGGQLSEESWRVADRGLAPRRRMINSVRHLRRWLANVQKEGAAYRWCKRCELNMEQRQISALWKLNSETWPETKSPLELAAQQYGIPQKDQARWAGLIDNYNLSYSVAPQSDH